MPATPLAESTTSPLKWAGGKRWLLPHLSPLWEKHSHRRLVEPFCGGLAVTLGLRPTHALLNDVNPHLVNFYRQLQSGLEATIPMENDSELFYQHRETFNQLIRDGQHETSQAAQLFYYLNRSGFNGLCRFNKSGLFNVPFGRYAKINYRRDFLVFRPLFAQWKFQLGDFEALLSQRRRLPLRRPSLRCSVHAIFRRRLRLGGSSPAHPLARQTPRPGRPLQSIDPAH